MSKPTWFNEEEARATKLAKQEGIVNQDAPQLKRVQKEPKRIQKAFYIQPKYAEMFEDFVFKQKRKNGRKAPELIEEAIKMLLEFYGEDTIN